MKRSLVPALVSACLLASAAGAQSAESISIQLNGAETVGDACRLTFVIRNELPKPVKALGLDLVMFDRSGGVAGYAAVDFGDLPAGKTRVRQYDVARGECSGMSRVLLNEVRACEIDGEPAGDCLPKLQLSTRSEIDFIL
ncbi:hypothetical protein [Labrenzia sp. 011]|uniref:hypothetical protein n=1 Tax=Labrenzia sp. 011 TaxID=2171494 RepID=UPI000D511B28|nr:hypothetical protein [Labrenzia sp. 011]PVB62393.1 hypothetical protein DCO57_06435 [Labrenzia sp. 011]